MTSCTDTDLQHLSRTVELARRGLGSVKPNPGVGAVVARGGEVVGEGGQRRDGGADGEAHARGGATLYVALDPCCHAGNTPPSTDAILKAGIRRVVVASDDPTEKANGRGL